MGRAEQITSSIVDLLLAARCKRQAAIQNTTKINLPIKCKNAGREIDGQLPYLAPMTNVGIKQF
jgi:hypothetical protein